MRYKNCKQGEARRKSAAKQTEEDGRKKGEKEKGIGD